MTKFIREIFALFLILGLVACGGGGGSPGNTSGGAEFFVSAPLEINLLPGETRSYSIGGGVPGYTASTGNSALIATIKDKTLTLTAVGSGKSTVSVKDATGKEVLITVNLNTGVDLYTSAPSDIVVAVGSTSEIFYAGGGGGLYSVSSSNTDIATVGVRGNQFVINGVSGGTAKVVVADSMGKSIPINVIVGSPNDIFTTAGDKVNVAVGGASLYKVGGGTTSYFVSSNDTSIATAKIVGNDLLISGIATGTTDINVKDTAGHNKTINVTVGAGAVDLFVTAPAAVVIPVNSGPIAYTIGGGKAPYTATSSNASVVTATVNGTTLTLRGLTSGTANVVVTDALGKTKPIAVTVGTASNVPLFTDAPSALTLTVDTVRSYRVAGGTGPYTVASSNVDVVDVVAQPSTSNGNVFDIKAKAIGTANIVIKDSLGVAVPVAVTVNSGSAIALTSFPATGAGIIGQVVSFKLLGGSPAYSIANSNPNIATAPGSVTNSGDSFTVTLVNIGTTTLTVTDAKGQSISILVTVSQENQTLRVQPANLSITADELKKQDVTLYVYGGKPAYRVFMADTKAPTPTLTTTANGAILQLSKDCTGGAAGPRTYQYTIVDSVGASVNASLTLDKICP